MKKKILLVITALLIFGMSIAVYAFGTNTSGKKAMSCCCCKGDSCPMTKDKTAGKDEASCCDKEDCCCKGGDSCCKGDSCPMKGKKDDGKPSAGQKPSCCDKEEAPKKDG